MEDEKTNANYELEIVEQAMLKTEGFSQAKLDYRTYVNYSQSPHLFLVYFNLVASDEHNEPILSIKLKVTYSIVSSGKLTFQRAFPLFSDGVNRCIEYSNGVTKKLYGSSAFLVIPMERNLLSLFEGSRSQLS
jgi:hypothetical protein